MKEKQPGDYKEPTVAASRQPNRCMPVPSDPTTPSGHLGPAAVMVSVDQMLWEAEFVKLMLWPKMGKLGGSLEKNPPENSRARLGGYPKMMGFGKR